MADRGTMRGGRRGNRASRYNEQVTVSTGQRTGYRITRHRKRFSLRHAKRRAITRAARTHNPAIKYL